MSTTAPARPLWTARTGGLPFLKGHGTGNDFVILPDPACQLDLTPALVRRLCDRTFGIGADGVLRVARTEQLSGVEAEGAEWFMDHHNADGSLAEMCGNGIRLYARYLVDMGLAAPGRLRIGTRSGVRWVDVPARGDVTVGMGAPVLGEPRVGLRMGGSAYSGAEVSMGNPHVVCRVDDPAALDLTAPLQLPPDVLPDGANLEFYSDRGDRLVMRVRERGVGETLSCGTGACAVAVVHAGQPRGMEQVVEVPGGTLRVRWTPDEVLLTGPAEIVAEGSWHGAVEGGRPAA